jgi:hypothetical protein
MEDELKEQIKNIILDTLGDEGESEANYALNTVFEKRIKILAQAILTLIRKREIEARIDELGKYCNYLSFIDWKYRYNIATIIKELEQQLKEVEK